MQVVTNFELAGLKKVASGKVREIYDVDSYFLFVASDRISAFDCVFAEGVPHKGCVLTQISEFWFQKLDFIPNHLITSNINRYPEELLQHRELLEGRSMLVRKAKPLPVECVVRGYLAGSGWAEYKKSRTICGQRLPEGLQLASPLPETLFTPSTKAQSGHDENISWAQCRSILGDDLAFRVRAASIELYEHGRAYAASRGIIIADTKFEFGLIEDELILIDEVLTPDSSRFWPESEYQPGNSPPSFDKQFVRDYLETLDWDKSPPPPALPEDVIQQTSRKYLEAYERLTGKALIE